MRCTCPCQVLRRHWRILYPLHVLILRSRSVEVLFRDSLVSQCLTYTTNMPGKQLTLKSFPHLHFCHMWGKNMLQQTRKLSIGGGGSATGHLFCLFTFVYFCISWIYWVSRDQWPGQSMSLDSSAHSPAQRCASAQPRVQRAPSQGFSAFGGWSVIPLFP